MHSCRWGWDGRIELGTGLSSRISPVAGKRQHTVTYTPSVLGARGETSPESGAQGWRYKVLGITLIPGR